MLRLDLYTRCYSNKAQQTNKRHHLMAFRINHKNTHLLLYILLSDNVATNPGPVTQNNNICRPFSVFCQNVRSLKSTYWEERQNSKDNKPSWFHDIVSTNQFDVIALTETWLDNHELLT